MGREHSRMNQPFHIQFNETASAQVIQINRRDSLAARLESLSFYPHLLKHPPVLVLVGGASGMTPDYLEELAKFFADIICPILQNHQGIVVDGGTDAGVMQLMGQARQRTGSTFPLVGVAAEGTVCIPNQPPPDFQDYATLEPHHTHFCLVPGCLWGDESPWIAEVANGLTRERSLTLLVNGGKISWQDVTNSVRVKRPVVVLAGSGRTADELAKAIAGDRTNLRANKLVDSGLLSAVNLDLPSDHLRTQIDQYFC